MYWTVLYGIAAITKWIGLPRIVCFNPMTSDSKDNRIPAAAEGAPYFGTDAAGPYRDAEE